MTQSERGGIVGGWLFKILLLLAIVGLAVFETGSVILARLAVDRVAIEASQEAGLECGRSGSSTKAREVAVRVAKRSDATVVGDVKCQRDFEIVKVTVRRTANTIVVKRIPGLKKFGVSTASHTGRIR